MAIPCREILGNPKPLPWSNQTIEWLKKMNNAFRAICGAILIGICSPAYTAIILNPVLSGPGSDTFDPAGFQTVDVTPGGSASQSSLESLANIRSVQDFTGFTAGGNTIDFSDSSIPDIQFRSSGSANGGYASTGSLYNTSPGAAIVLDNASTAAAVYIIDFGSYNSSTAIFDSNQNAVSAAGFIISQAFSGVSYVIDFLTDTDNILQTISYTGLSNADGNGDQQEAFIGHISGTENIGQIRVTRTGSTFSSGLDDLGFTTFGTVPLPATIWLVISGLVGVAGLARRKKTRR